MAKPTQITVEKRDLTGRKVKKLRREDILPANIYGRDVKSLAIKLDHQKFLKTYENVGETSLIELNVKGESDPRPAMITDIHYDPVTGDPLHVDFRQVDLKQKVVAEVPVKTTGKAPAVEEADGVLMVNLSEIEVEALPADIPDSISIDIGDLKEIGDQILAKNLKVDRDKIKLQVDENTTIVSVQAQMEEIEEPEPEVVPEDEETLEGEEVHEGEEAETAEGVDEADESGEEDEKEE